VLQRIDVREHRLGVVISGDEDWSRVRLAQLYGALQPVNALWLANTLSCLPDYALNNGSLVRRDQVISLLGSESDVVVVDGYSGLNPDSVAALAGTIVKGGVIIILAPSFDEWASFSDPEYQKITVYPHSSSDIPGLFLRHFSEALGRYCNNSDFIKLDINTGDEVLEVIANRFSPRFVARSVDGDLFQCSCTDSQQVVVRAINRVCTGHRKRPLVLTADRGRGKSAAIGMALAGLIQTSGPYQFVVTAPSLAAVDRLFAHCAGVLGVSMDMPGELCWQGSSVRYCLPENVEEQSMVSMLIVDEAAAIGTPLLMQWLGMFSRVVFSSTVHGYEGSGQGFALRFQQTLKEVMPQHKCLTLTKPIRWGEGDAVESFINEVFLLDADADHIGDYDVAEMATGINNIGRNGADVDHLIRIRRMNRIDLVKQASVLRGLFGLLVTAHYKTTPGDLRNLLDGPNLEIFVATYHDGGNESVVGGLLLAKEGAFDDTLASAIWQGHRRPRGHVMPQTLAVQCGYEGGLTLKSARIIRIAVNPGIQQRGLGKRLVEAAKSYARQERFDWLGSSFGATEPLIHFWRACGLEPVQIGISLDAASGCYSALVLAPLDKAVKTDFVQLRKRFRAHFLLAQKNYYQKMPVALLLSFFQRLIEECPASISSVDLVNVQRDVDGFIQYQWPYDVVFPSLRCWFLDLLLKGEVVTYGDDVALLIELLIRQQSLESVARSWGKGGEKVFLKTIRVIVSNLNDNISNLHGVGNPYTSRKLS